MTPRPFSRPRLALSALAACALVLGGRALAACADDADDGLGTAAPAGGDDASTSDAPAPTTRDASDTAPDATVVADAGRDAACATPKPATTSGETCVGFGEKPETCDPACGHPSYGYVCFGGGPPAFTGCVQVFASALGETYCCPENACVAQPDQDGMCAATPATPHRYQCPPAGDAGQTARAPAGCVASGSGGSAVETFYCCP